MPGQLSEVMSEDELMEVCMKIGEVLSSDIENILENIKDIEIKEK